MTSDASPYLCTVFLNKLADYSVATFRQTEEELRENLVNA
jgi:hypothetical protein